jgi:hypothetical protein
MEKEWAILCLGVEPRVYGPFEDLQAAEDFLYNHADVELSCLNGIGRDEHSVLQMW